MYALNAFAQVVDGQYFDPVAFLKYFFLPIAMTDYPAVDKYQRPHCIDVASAYHIIHAALFGNCCFSGIKNYFHNCPCPLTALSRRAAAIILISLELRLLLCRQILIQD